MDTQSISEKTRCRICRKVPVDAVEVVVRPAFPALHKLLGVGRMSPHEDVVCRKCLDEWSLE